jgi:hypothetical protein
MSLVRVIMIYYNFLFFINKKLIFNKYISHLKKKVIIIYYIFSNYFSNYINIFPIILISSSL